MSGGGGERRGRNRRGLTPVLVAIVIAASSCFCRENKAEAFGNIVGPRLQQDSFHPPTRLTAASDQRGDDWELKERLEKQSIKVSRAFIRCFHLFPAFRIQLNGSRPTPSCKSMCRVCVRQNMSVDQH
jgi:hypothetical protein